MYSPLHYAEDAEAVGALMDKILKYLGKSSEEEVDTEFTTFKKKFGKSYNTKEEENKRKINFIETLLFNKKDNREDSSKGLGLTQFADVSTQEMFNKAVKAKCVRLENGQYEYSWP